MRRSQRVLTRTEVLEAARTRAGLAWVWAIAAAVVAALALATAADPAPISPSASSNIALGQGGQPARPAVDADRLRAASGPGLGNLTSHVRVQPDFAIGVARGVESVRLATVRGGGSFRFLSAWDAWTPYVGGGLGADLGRAETHGTRSFGASIYLHLLGGIEKKLANGSRFFVESKVTMDKGTKAEISIGWALKH